MRRDAFIIGDGKDVWEVNMLAKVVDFRFIVFRFLSIMFTFLSAALNFAVFEFLVIVFNDGGGCQVVRDRGWRFYVLP